VGNDSYQSGDSSLGAGLLGIGLLIDLEGSDSYGCRDRCEGASSEGVGLLRDVVGDDNYSCRGACQASASAGFGILRDDAGNDRYMPQTAALAYGESSPGVALLWEREGQDNYTPSTSFTRFYAVLSNPDSADALFVDEGTGLDAYSPFVSEACNACIWSRSPTSSLGKRNSEGNDDRGGLAFVLANHWP
jgi:hypothetical protein